MRRQLVVVAVVAMVATAGLAGGCAGPDLDKVTYPRTVVPAGTSGPAGDPARLSEQGLRLVDPCDLLDTELMAKFGTPDDNVAQDYDSCRNYMTTTGGESLSFTVRVGEATGRGTLERATERVGGFRAEQSTVDGACFLTLVIEEPEPDLAVDLQVGLKTGDACAPARDVAAGVADGLRTDAELRTPEPGSLVGLDPCEVAGELPAAALTGAEEPEPFGLHECGWRTDGGAELDLRFGHLHDPADEPEDGSSPVDLGGGVSAVQLPRSTSFPACRLEWLHRGIEDGRGDVVTMEVRDVRKEGFDACAAARAFATALVPTLPRG